MQTITGIMYSASRALLADQDALTTTANNISNQNTTGYTRREVTFSDTDTVTIGTQQGSSNVTATTTAVRDRVLLNSVQQATEASSASTARSSALSNLESLFTVGSSGTDSSGIGSAITSFFSSMSTLAATPSDSTALGSANSAGQAIANAFNRTATQLTAQTSSLNKEVQTTVAQVNSLTQQVSALNAKIRVAGSGEGQDTLIDQRDSLVTQLSGLIGVNTTANDDNTIGLSLADGTPLISGTQTLQLSSGLVNGQVHIYSDSKLGGADVTSQVQGGTIGGDLQAIYTDIPNVSAQLNTLAGSIAGAVNAQNAVGVNGGGTAAGALFSGTTAATIKWTATSSDIAISSSTSGSGDNAQAMGNLQTQALAGGQTFSTYYSSALSALGQAASDASTASTANAAVLSQNSTQMDALSGVSLDTEAANLTQYQRSYDAAAKVISIMNDLLAQAINLGTPTTVS